MMFMLFNSYLVGTTCGGETAYHTGAPNFTLVVCGVRVAQSLVFRVVFCRSFVEEKLFTILEHLISPSLLRDYHLKLSITTSETSLDVIKHF